MFYLSEYRSRTENVYMCDTAHEADTDRIYVRERKTNINCIIILN